eukprot:scaffold9606_cov99-Cylindrotheca_fusiformis.AAC.3
MDHQGTASSSCSHFHRESQQWGNQVQEDVTTENPLTVTTGREYVISILEEALDIVGFEDDIDDDSFLLSNETISGRHQ